MTCIVAVLDGRCVVMGSDSAASEGDLLTIRSNSSKSWIFEHSNESIICGFCGNFGEGQFIRHAFKWPARKHGQSWEQWLVKDVQPALQKALKVRFEDRKDVDIDWALLIGVKPGRIFALSRCGDVEESSLPFAAIGSGANAALGCLFALRDTAYPSWEKAELALRAAQQFHLSVRGPFYVDALV